MLLIANQSPYKKALPTDMTNADLMLTQDAVYALSLQQDWNNFNAVYALKDDVAARGLLGHINDKIQVIELSQFVKLTANHHPIVNWS